MGRTRGGGETLPGRWLGGVGLAQPEVTRFPAAAEAVRWVWLVVTPVFELEPLEPSIRDPQAGWAAVPADSPHAVWTVLSVIDSWMWFIGFGIVRRSVILNI